jgi:uncharacterized tellurite resistance protein B-like protein
MTASMATRNELIADLLMGAAFADQRFEGSEYEAVKRALAHAMGTDEVPPVLAARLEWFKPAEFDLASTVAGLGLETDEERRQLLELILCVHEADEVLDVDEDEYLRQVAHALGLEPKQYADLVIQDLAIDVLRDAAKKLLVPPPLPGSAARKPRS